MNCLFMLIILNDLYPVFTLLSDALAGHDPLDSTTVSDEYQPIDLDEVDCMAKLRGVTVGIPWVFSHTIYNCQSRLLRLT